MRDRFGDAVRARPACSSRPRSPTCTRSRRSRLELALETHGVDVLETATLCRGPRFARPSVTVGSTASIFELFRAEQCYLWEKKLVPHAPGAIGQRRRPELRAARVLDSVGRHVAAGLLRARRARPQLHLLGRLLRQQRHADGARARPEVGGGVQEPAQGAPGRGDQADRRLDHAEHAAARSAPPSRARWTSPSAAASSRRCAPPCTASRLTSRRAPSRLPP
ncbi:MAG: hypothetical protein MZU91_12170 [Desulfosudis oleivorans]|nr:hypothetical protein [Desulfosudis oleivorans]